MAFTTFSAALGRLLHRDPDALPRTVGVDRAVALLDAGAVLIDVRESGEWRTGHARRARHVPLDRIAAEAARLPREATVVVMCASGMRSRGGAAQLRAQGYRATSLSGGLAAWRAAGEAVTR